MASDLRAENLATLERSMSAKARKGARLLETLSEEELTALLRSHLVRDIVSDRDYSGRDAVDELLEYYSQLELAAGLGVVPGRLSRKTLSMARANLTDPAVRTFYEAYYPLILPQMLRMRAEGQPVDLGVPKAGLYEAYVSLMEVSRLLQGEDIYGFLAFLDDGYWEDEDGKVWDMGTTLQTLSSASALARALARPRERWGPNEKAVSGLGKFLMFCEELDNLLRAYYKYPLAQSALWHYHGYWFEQIGGQVGGVIATALERYRDLAMPAVAGRREAKAALATHWQLDRSLLGLRRLTAGVYRAPLEAVVYQDAWADQRAASRRRIHRRRGRSRAKR